MRTNHPSAKWMLFILAIFLAHTVYAVDERYSAKPLTGRQIAKDSSSVIQDDTYASLFWRPRQTTFSVKSLINFKIDEGYTGVLPDSFRVVINYKVIFTYDYGNQAVSGTEDNIYKVLTYSKASPYIHQSLHAKPNWYGAQVIIKSVTYEYGDSALVQPALMLTNEIVVDREYEFEWTANAVKSVSKNTSTVPSIGELEVWWPTERAADEYDLEWSYIDSIALPNYKIGNVYDTNKIFLNNSSRVTIKQESYFIPIVYEGRGRLFYRVRAVKVRKNGMRLESLWSSKWAAGLGTYEFTALDDSLNWQAATSFAEDGKRKSVIQYFDGSLKSRQTVTKDNVTKTTIVAETLYDFQGRPVIQVMPAPTLDSLIKYRPQFNRLENGEYDKELYDGSLGDTCYCSEAAPGMDSIAGAANYYSSENPLAGTGIHKYIPKAQGFVFAQTKYTPDNTGRISAQGGVGKAFRIGAGHETQYKYGKADQEELDALFGTEVGDAAHYFKNTVRDANGQVSISYVDMHGRTIATALAGDAAVALDNLASNNSVYVVKQLLDSQSNMIKGTAIESSKGLVVTQAGTHQFIYSLLPDSVHIKDFNLDDVCYDCIYDLQIVISDECNDSTLQAPIIIKRTNYQLSTACDTIALLPMVDTAVFLKKGNYLVTKTLTINNRAFTWYRDSVFMQRNTHRTLEQAIEAEKQALLQTIECKPVSCDTCTRMDKMIRAQMLSDVTPPYGQYANPDHIDIFSIFGKGSATDFRFQEVARFLDENGNEYGVMPAAMSKVQFLAEFKTAWAEQLLPLHPEYLKLLRYEQFRTSHAWDQKFESTDSYQTALDSGYLNPGNFTGTGVSVAIYNHAKRDPFFTDYVNSTVSATEYNSMKDSLNGKLFGTSWQPINVWSLATIMAHCKPNDENCISLYDAPAMAFNIDNNCSGDRDMAWRYFRELYLQEKRRIIDNNLNTYHNANGGRDVQELLNYKYVLNFPIPEMYSMDAVRRDSAEAAGDLADFIDANCLGYVQRWWQELKPCGYNTTDSLWIVPKLLEVCREGGDVDHIFGASSVKPSSGYQYKSFEDVLKAYPGRAYDATCNAYLITAPLPYNKQPVYYDKPVLQKPDSCECATIGNLYQKYQSTGVDSNFAAYIFRTTGTQIYQGVLDTLRMACNGQVDCRFLKEELTLPPVLQCGGEDVCIDCSRFAEANADFREEFPDVYPSGAENLNNEATRNNRLYEAFMNRRFGFSKHLSDYLAFAGQCGVAVDASGGMFSSPCALADSLLSIIHDFDTAYAAPTTWGYSLNGTPMATPQEFIQNGQIIHPPGLGTAPYSYTPICYFNYLCMPLGYELEFRVKNPLSSFLGASVYSVDPGNPGGFYTHFVSDLHNPSIIYSSYLEDGKGRPASSTVINPPVQGTIGDWHVFKIKVTPSSYDAYFDGRHVQRFSKPSDLIGPVGSIWGFYFNVVAPAGVIDWVKLNDHNGVPKLFEDFNDANHLRGVNASALCPPPTCTSDFAGYFNQRRGTQYTFSQIDSLYCAAGIALNVCGTDTNKVCTPTGSPCAATLCGRTEPVFNNVPLPVYTPCTDSTRLATWTGALLHEYYTDSLKGTFSDRYLARCMNARYNETFTVASQISEFHYTLYYYDQAGNLVKTVPPQGVDVSKFGHLRSWSDSVILARRNKQVLRPDHQLPTRYRYNTLNQVVQSVSPDGGLSEFWYDRLGRLAISRNAKQRLNSATEDNRLYSYTKYDTLGRINEVGQVSNVAGNGAMTDAIARSNGMLRAWLTNLNNKRSQITNTIYDLEYANFTDPGRLIVKQRNLRNRVSYTTFTDTGTLNTHNQGTFYTYDVLGNVDTLLQDYGSSLLAATQNMMNTNENRYKKIVYNYDLVSGKVNMVMYQRNWGDQWIHRYTYDAENRLILTETSPDSLTWEKEAGYEYYKHGPLARMTLGAQQVQGVDYAYTLQGWLKGINSTGGTRKFDMGGDGDTTHVNGYTAADAMGLTLNYHAGDYAAVGGVTPFPGSSGALNNDYRPLYNGNISSMSVYQKRFEGGAIPGGPLIFYNYRYDQLNRLVGQDAYSGSGFNAANSNWDSLPSMGERLKERIRYDANGNIMKYLRKGIEGTTAHMDSLSYKYYPNSNRLSWIKDTVSANTYPDKSYLVADINNQADSNYVYDSIGNLIADKAEKITGIKWNVYGKIQEITRTATAELPATNIKYTYDASGNRISQLVTHSDGKKFYTWYVRDAQGNILSTYTAQDAVSSSLANLDLQYEDRFIYGSSRVGTFNAKVGVGNGPGDLGGYNYQGAEFRRGYRQYELANHLGNVLAVVSDKKFGVTYGGSSLIAYYEPEIVSATDYYPFGMVSRYASGKYRFGFNGKENDNEVKGVGGQQDYGMRVYDPRVGRFLSVDPISSSYPELTPYQFASNRPIDGIDQDGLEFKPTPEQEKAARAKAAIDAIKAITPPQKQQAAAFNLPPPNSNATLGQGPAPHTWLAKEGVQLKKQYELDKEMQRRADADPIAYGGSGFGNGMVRDPFIQESAQLLCPGCQLIYGGMQINSGIETGNKAEVFAGALNLVGGGLSMYGRRLSSLSNLTRKGSLVQLPKSLTVFDGRSTTLIENTLFEGTIAVENDVLMVQIKYIQKIDVGAGEYSTYKSLIEKIESIAKANGVKVVKITGNPLKTSKAEVPFTQAGYTITKDKPDWDFPTTTRTKTLE